MRILLLSSFLPYPIFSGGHIRLFNIIKLLSKKHQIYLVCEKRDYQTKDDIKKVEEYCKKVITFNRKKQWSWQNIVKTGFSSKPFLITGHASNKMKKEIDDLLDQEKFDLIHVETFYVMQNLPISLLKIKTPIVLTEHNIEYLVYKRFADRCVLPLRLLLYMDVLKLKYWEEKYWRKATKLVSVSESDKKTMSRKRKDVDIVPNGVDITKFRIQNSEFRIHRRDRKILFIGDFRWVENRDAVEWILKEIWPLISSKFNPSTKLRTRVQSSKLDIRLWIVGRNIPDSIKKLATNSSIIFDENAPSDTWEIYQKSDILLAPIRVGGGTSFKILEAMASGVPVITTSLGNEGIEVKDREQIIIADNAFDFAQKTLALLANKNLYEKVSKNARKLIEEKYDWEKIVWKLEEVYKSAV